MLTLYEGKHLEIETRYWVNASSWNTTKIFLPELLIYFHCVHYSLFRVAPEFCVILFYIFPTFLTKSEQIMLFISNLQTIFISNFLFDRVRQSLPMGIYLFSIYQKICFKYWTLSPRRFQSNQQEKLVCICKVQNSKFLTQVHFFFQTIIISKWNTILLLHIITYCYIFLFLVWIFIFPETLLGDEAQIFWIYYLFSLFMWTRKFQFPVQLGECIKAGAKPVRTVSHRSCQEHSAAAAPLDSPLKGNKTFFIIQGPFSFLFQKMISDSRLIKISVLQVLVRIFKKIRKVLQLLQFIQKLSDNFFPLKVFWQISAWGWRNSPPACLFESDVLTQTHLCLFR